MQPWYWTKDCSFFGISVEIVLGIMKVIPLFEAEGLDFQIISAISGEEKHKDGYAVDIYSGHAVEVWGAVQLEKQIKWFAESCQESLGPQYKFILVDFRGDDEHFHLECQLPSDRVLRGDEAGSLPGKAQVLENA